MDIRRISAMASKEWREIRRDRLFFSLAFIVPLMLLIVFTYGLSFDVKNIPFAVVDRDGTSLSRDYAYRFISSRYFDFKGYAMSERELEPLLAGNKIRVAIIIPEHFQRDITAGLPAHVQALIDGTFPSRTQTTKGYVVAINSAVSLDTLAGFFAKARGISLSRARQGLEPVRLEARYLYNQSAVSAWSLVPKLIMLVLMVSPPLLTAVGVVREKESGAIYNIYSSTVSRGEFLLGKFSPYVSISAVNAVVLWLISVGLLRAPFKGHFIFFILSSFVFVACTAGIGLVVSLLVRTQLAAIILSLILTFVPVTDYSGLLMPVDSLDAAGRIQAHIIPAMYYTDIVVGTFLKGMGFDMLWGQLAVLLLYTAALMAAGYFLFRKRLAS